MNHAETVGKTQELASLASLSSLASLRALFAEMGSVLVCYSGGIDSALMLAVAHEILGPGAIGMTAVSPSLAELERDGAIEVAKQIGARHELVPSNEMEDPSYVANHTDRCFHCKSELYRLSAQKQRDWATAFVVNGTNIDDLGDYRPGLEAAKQAGVRSPLVELGLGKKDVREMAAAIGLTIWNKPAAACLSSRIPYGTLVTRERLTQIGSLEADLHRLGLKQVRVRWHELASDGDRTKTGSIARIEVAQDEIMGAFEARDAITSAGKRAGFAYVTLDLQGYRTGSHNEVLSRKQLPIVG